MSLAVIILVLTLYRVLVPNEKNKTETIAIPALATRSPEPSGKAPVAITPIPEKKGNRPSPPVRLRPGAPLSRSDVQASPFEWVNERLLHRMKTDAWIRSRDLDPGLEDYDQALQEASRERGRLPDPWFNGWKEFKNGRYHGLLVSLGTSEVRPFVTELVLESRMGRTHLRALWIAWQSAKTPYFLPGAWKSPFAESEIYLNTLHFPPQAFAPVLNSARGPVEGAVCREVILMHSISSSERNDFIETISGRAYCRISLKELRPVGQFALVLPESFD